MSSTGTVLILDDSLTVRMDLIQVFEAAGWRCISCATAAQACESLARESVDVLVLDAVLPDADGVDVLRALRIDPATASLPVLMLSAEAEVKHRILGLWTGADEYIGKPYDGAYVVARARELIRPHTDRPSDVSRVLVIDDSDTVRSTLGDLLAANGYEVETADSGTEGLRLMAAHPHDAVLLDAGLPDIDGPTVIRRLRLDAALRAIPCLLLTASDDTDTELDALDSGADAFVHKDGGSEVLLATLSALLRRASESRPLIDTASLLGPKKILAVGDADFLATLPDRLRGAGYDLVPARSGEEALQLLAFETMDCILLHFWAQQPEGLAICQRIKSVPGVRDVPLILMATDDDQQTLIEALAAGADDYVLASGDTEVLAARIRAQLWRNQLLDEHRQVRARLLRKEIEATKARAVAEIALTKAAMFEELERKNKELETFSYSVSHDLRAPLRTVDGFTKILIESVADHLDESGVHYAERISSGVARMTEMIDDLLELSRVGRAPLQRDEVDLAELATTILDDLAAGEPDRHVAVTIEAGLSAFADPRLIRNVFENLIGNAWKFTTQTEHATVQVGCRPRPDGATDQTAYFVRDNGNGFDMARAGRLFSPFQRLHSQSEFPGTGIGLATVHRIIDRHTGQVWAESEPGHGATFWFTLSRG